MTEADRPNHPSNEHDHAEEPARADPGLAVSGRSASVGEIGRELGELDFDPDDLLSSLRPFEPESDAPRQSVADAADALQTDHRQAVNIAPPRLPSQVDADERAPSPPVSARQAPTTSAATPAEPAEPIAPRQPVPPASSANVPQPPPVFEAEEPSTRALPVPPPVVPTRSSAKSPTRTPGAPRRAPEQRSEPHQEPVSHRSSPFSASAPAWGGLSNRPPPPTRRASVAPPSSHDPHAPELTTSDDPVALDGLLALPPQREQALAFENERAAYQHVEERGLANAYAEIIAILKAEGAAARQSPESVENALVISELHALLGDAEAGMKAVETLGPTAPAALCTQRRQLALSADDVTSYAQYLKSDVRASSSHEGRRHIMALYADVVRLILQDDAEQRKHLELSLRACPSDARFWIHKSLALLLDQLSGTKARALSIPESLKLTEALRDLSALRTDTGSTTHPAGALRAARGAWLRRDWSGLLQAIEGLRGLDSMDAAAAWLYVCMTVFMSEHRKRGTALLETLLETGDIEADLALLERRLHDTFALPNSVEVFAHACVAQLSAVERLALGVAVDADAQTLRVLSDAAAGGPNATAFILAIEQLYRVDTTSAVADVPTLKLKLGSQLCQKPNRSPMALEADSVSARNASDAVPVWWSDLERLEALTPDAALVRALRWVRTMAGCDGEPMAQALVQLADELEPTDGTPLLALTASLAELAGAPGVRAQCLELAAAADLQLESVQRGVMAMNDSIGANAVLQRWRDRLPSSLERTLVDLELCAAEEMPRTSILAIINDCLTAQPTIAALAAVLGAAATSGARQIWPALVEHATSVSVQRLTAGLDWFEQHSVGATDSAEADPLELGFGAPSLRIALTQLEDLVANSDVHASLWQTTKILSGAVPFDVAQVESSIWSTDPTNPSALMQHWQHLRLAVCGGDAAVFDAERQAAADLDGAAAVDRLLDAAALDPDAVPTIGSVKATRAVLEKQPSHLGAMRLELRERARTGRLRDVGSLAAQIAQQLDQTLRLAHAWLAITSTTYASDVAEQSPIHLDGLIQPGDEPPAWALRRLYALAQSRRDDRSILEYATRLREACTRPMDAATLTLRAAEAASRLEQWDLSVQLLDRAVELCPEHLVALSMRAEFLEARGDVLRAAAAYDALATAACMPAHKVAAWVQAASLWTDSKHASSTDADPSQAPADAAASGKPVPEDERGELAQRALIALERAVELDPTHVEANARLRNEYLARGDLEKLELLLTRQLLRVDGAERRAELELDRAKTLADLGRIDEARSGLERALSIIPDHVPALLLSAQLHEKAMDFEAAEQQWLRIASHSMDGALQLEAYRRLAVLYETYLEVPARAEVAYREVLRRSPNDPIAERLAQLLLRQDNPQAAVDLLEQLVAQARDSNLERTYSLELARIFDEVMNDRRRAEAALENARRRWPTDISTLRALAAFYARGKDQAALNALLDRSLTDARRALGSGRFDVSFFEVIAGVAELRDESESCAAARGTLDALMARDATLNGLGLDAANECHADALAPEVLSLPLRALLRRSGWALCAAQPIDLRALRVTPLEHANQDLASRLQQWARGFGIQELVLYVSPALGAVCQPTASVPATLVVGQAYLALEDERVKEALAWRALRVLSANAAALANTAPIDLPPLLVGYLSAYLPDWMPPGVDPAKVTAIRDRIQQAFTQPPDRDLPMLAADVAASIGNRASQLGLAMQQWGSRTALLALGSPSVVLAAIAAATGQTDRIGSDAAERQKWILRNPEARDLIVFSVSDPYLQARAQGLARR